MFSRTVLFTLGGDVAAGLEQASAPTVQKMAGRHWQREGWCAFAVDGWGVEVFYRSLKQTLK
jgi:hypothetical protein